MLTTLAAQGAHIVADMVNNIVAAELLETPRALDRIRHGHVVAHDLRAEIAASLDH